MEEDFLRLQLKHSIMLPRYEGCFTPPNPFYGMDNVNLQDYYSHLEQVQKAQASLESFPSHIENVCKKLKFRIRILKFLKGIFGGRI